VIICLGSVPFSWRGLASMSARDGGLHPFCFLFSIVSSFSSMGLSNICVNAGAEIREERQVVACDVCSLPYNGSVRYRAV
jgi:hypothetical protein